MTTSYFDTLEAMIDARDRALQWGQSYLEQTPFKEGARPFLRWGWDYLEVVRSVEQGVQKIGEAFVEQAKRAQDAWAGWWRESARTAGE